MPNLLERTWYGATATADQERLNFRRPLWVAILALGLVVLRYNLPFAVSDTMTVYDHLAWALTHEANWGKQALVGVLEYPPLPTLAMLLIRWLPFGDELNAGHLLVAMCQVWTLVYLVRLVRLHTTRWWGTVLAVALLIVPAMAPSGLQADPFWMLAVILTSALFHACRWERQRSLRDAVVIALLCGVLVLGGIVGVLAAAAVLTAMWLNGDRRMLRSVGGLTLLGMPLVYVLLLYPLFNWLIMDHPFFALQRLAPWFDPASMAVALRHGGVWRLLLPLALVALAAWSLRRRSLPLAVKLGWSLAAVAGVVSVLRLGSGLMMGGEWVLTVVAMMPLLLHLALHRSGPGTTSLGGGAAARLAVANVCVLVAIASVRLGARSPEPFLQDLPPPEQFMAAVDTDWSNARILVYHLRAAVYYSHAQPDRFPGNLDFNLKDLAAIRGDEQYFLLLPPNNGTWFAPHDPTTTHLRLDVAPENREVNELLTAPQVWPSGWQLWRVVRDNSDLLLPPVPPPAVSRPPDSTGATAPAATVPAVPEAPATPAAAGTQ